MGVNIYTCPNCTGGVQFDSAKQRITCPYCESEFEIEALDEYKKELELDAAGVFSWKACERSGADWQANELECLSTGSCPSCGAELVGDENTIATVCPCCGNAQIMQKRIEGMLRPACVLPFTIDKKEALAIFKRLCEGKTLLPACFKDEVCGKGMQGVYVPFWLFDASTFGHASYNAQKRTMWISGDYYYTRTDYYHVVREGNMCFEKIPADASQKMNDEYMDALEPFDYSKLCDFKAAYLAGFLAEKYDVDIEGSKPRVQKRMQSTIETALSRTVTGYTTVMHERTAVTVLDGKAEYALLPVWVLNLKHRDTNHQFMINGQSGRVVGKFPIDVAKAWKYIFLYTGVFASAFILCIQLIRL